MANDPSLALRQAVVERLRENADLIEITTADKVFGEQPYPVPDRPFTRYGVDDITPRRTSCWDGATNEFPIHSFSAATYSDEVKRMNAAIAADLDGAVLELDDGNSAILEWLGSTVLRDAADPKAWHGIARFRATV